MLQKIDHVGVVVKNLDIAMKAYENMLGVPPWSKGVVQSSWGYRLVNFPIKDQGRIELIEPDLAVESRFARFLKERGEGLAHISIFAEDFDNEVKRLRENGFSVEITTSTIFPGYPFRMAWVPPEECHGVWIELVDAEAHPPLEKEI